MQREMGIEFELRAALDAAKSAEDQTQINGLNLLFNVYNGLIGSPIIFDIEQSQDELRPEKISRLTMLYDRNSGWFQTDLHTGILTLTQNRLFSFFVDNKNVTLNVNDILHGVWDESYDPNSVHSYIRSLRSKLEPGRKAGNRKESNSNYIKRYGLAYTLNPELNVIESPNDSEFNNPPLTFSDSQL